MSARDATDAASPPGGRGLRWLAGVVLATAAPAAVIVSYLRWRERLPDPMPSHWGVHNQVDQTASLAGMVTALTTVSAVGAVVAIAGAVAGYGWPARARAGRWLVAVGAGIAWFGAGLWLVTGLLAVDRPVAQAAPPPSWHLLGLLAGMFAAAGLGYAACPGPPPHPPATRRPPAGAPRADLAAGQPHYQERARFVVGILVPSLLIAAVAVPLTAFISPWAGMPVLLIGVVIALMMINVITVDERGLRVGLSPWGWPAITVPLAEIEQADVVDEIRPMEWGGWGYRLRPDGSRGWIVGRGPGVELRLSGDRRFVASVRDPQRVAGLLNTLADRQPR